MADEFDDERDPLRGIIIQFLEIDIEAKLFEARLAVERHAGSIYSEDQAMRLQESRERVTKLEQMLEKLRGME